MTPKERAAMQQALEALEALNPYPASKENQRFDAITALLEALAQSVSQEPVKREHITDGSPCWCNPELNYKDPETGAEVWVHKEPQ